jgi:hypothetical protein
MTWPEAEARIRDLERIGSYANLRADRWLKDGGLDESFKGYHLEAMWVTHEDAWGRQQEPHIFLVGEIGYDDQVFHDVTHKSDEDFLSFVRSLSPATRYK